MADPGVVSPSAETVDAPAASMPTASAPDVTAAPDRAAPPVSGALTGQQPARAKPATPAAPSDVESHFWLTHGDQVVLAALSAIMLALFAVHWVRLSNWGKTPVEIERLPARQFEFRLDVNQATWVEWSQLDGIGDALAHRIVADREQNGPFGSIEELRRVRGIGPKTLERIRPWLQVGQSPGDQQPVGQDAP